MEELEAAVADFLADKGVGEGGTSGTYRRDAERELDRFLTFLADRSPPPETVADLSTDHLRAYARHLAAQGWQPNTTRTYYNIVSAFVGWAVREGYLSEHIATRRRAMEPLESASGEDEDRQQVWTAADRRAITRFVDRQAEAAVDGLGEDRAGAIKATRDRALVYLLAYSGVRGAEVFRHRDDERREGLRWRHVSLSDNYVRVFAKKGAWDDRALPGPVVGPLDRARRVLDPPSEEWPVFPTLHRPTLSRRFREAMTDRGYTAAEVESLRTETHPNPSLVELCVTYDVPPPAITTDAARGILERLCEAADIDVEDGDYLKPHGARRGAGEVMVRSFGYAAAARALDNSEEIVREHYSHIEAGELADQLTTAFEAVDRPGSGGDGETATDGENAEDTGDGLDPDARR